MRSLFLSICAILFVGCNNQSETTAKEPEANTKYALQVEGMTCQSGCKKLIETKMAKHPGVVSFSINFDEAIANVTFDDSMTDTTSLRMAIAEINNGAYSASGLAESFEKK